MVAVSSNGELSINISSASLCDNNDEKASLGIVHSKYGVASDWIRNAEVFLVQRNDLLDHFFPSDNGIRFLGGGGRDAEVQIKSAFQAFLAPTYLDPIKKKAELNFVADPKNVAPVSGASLKKIARMWEYCHQKYQIKIAEEDSSVTTTIINDSSKKATAVSSFGKLNYDVMREILLFLAGSTIIRGYACYNTWGRSGGGWSKGEAGLVLKEHIGQSIEDIGMQLWCRGALVFGAKWGIQPRTSDVITLSWNSDENTDATRSSKPHTAEIAFEKKNGEHFVGACKFPGEGSVGLHGIWEKSKKYLSFVKNDPPWGDEKNVFQEDPSTSVTTRKAHR